MADKLFRWRKNNAGAGEIIRAGGDRHTKIIFYPVYKSLTVPKMSHSAENVAQCRKVPKNLLPIFGEAFTFSISFPIH